MSSNPPGPPPLIPALPPSLLPTILFHLLPPSPPLPTELVSKTLLNRLLYLPPPPDDVDAHLTPFPPSTSSSASSSDGQPISSRLNELAREHSVSPVQYSREGHEVFARIVILPEGANTIPEAESGQLGTGDQVQRGVEIWFEHEPEDGPDGRGWVYHSARLPLPLSTSSSSENVRWIDSPSLLPSPPSEQQHPLPSDSQLHTDQHDTDADPTIAPKGYWDSFSSPSSSSSAHHHQEDAGEDEDAYWAQYSRPVTAPITPGTQVQVHDFYSNGTGAKEGEGQEQDPRKVAEAVTRSLNALKREREAEAGRRSLASGEAAWTDGANDEREDEEVLSGSGKDHDGMMWQGAKCRTGSGPGAAGGVEVIDKLQGKIAAQLSRAWTAFRGEVQGQEEKEGKAMEWLRISREVIDRNRSTLHMDVGSLTNDYGGTTNTNGFPREPREEVGVAVATATLRAKLEVLLDMYEILDDPPHGQGGVGEGFWRLIEGTITNRSAPMPGLEVEDDVTRQTMYYE